MNETQVRFRFIAALFLVVCIIGMCCGFYHEGLQAGKAYAMTQSQIFVHEETVSIILDGDEWVHNR